MSAVTVEERALDTALVESGERSAEHAERLGKAISAMGNVERDGDVFMVMAPGMPGRKNALRVNRDETGRVVCSCDAFRAGAADPAFRCEHILAVKYALLEQSSRTSEAGAAPDGRDEENLNAESRRSVRGEQDRDASRQSGPANGHAGQSSSLEGPIEDTEGEKEMIQTELREASVEGLEPQAEAHDNVLDFSATLKELRRHVDPKLVKQREGWRDRNGNVQMVDYVEWHTVADILDDAAPNWRHEVKDIRQIGDIMTVTVAITIDGVTREGIGTGNLHNEMGIKKAEHDALKRAAVKFGIARDLYKKESDVIEREGSSQGLNDDGFPTEPVARNLNELVTAKQLGMIRAIAREIGVDPNDECQSVMHCNTDELSKKAASALIDHLKGLQHKSDSPGQVPLRRAG